MDRLMSPQQAAEVLGCSRWHVRDLILAGKLPRRLGGSKGNRYKIAESDLKAYIASIEAPLPHGGTAA